MATDYQRSLLELVSAIALGYEEEGKSPDFPYTRLPDREIEWLAAWILSEGWKRGEPASPTSPGAISVGAPGGRLTVGPRHTRRDRYATVRVGATGIDAQRPVMWEEILGLGRFVSTLEQDWRGWSGERIFETVEGEMRIAASHDGSGHVVLTVELAESLDPGGWRVLVKVPVEAGEALSRFASDLQQLAANG